MHNKTIKKREPPFNSMYSETDVLMFYINSSNKFYPGEGKGENIKDSHKPLYEPLSKIDNWRQKLSNQWISEFKLDGLKWLSVEHYYQASKFKNNNYSYYLQFSLDSGSALSKDPIMAHGAGSTTGRINGKLFRNKEVKIDPDFFNGRSEKEMFNAQYSKFKYHKDLQKVLLYTNNAKLMHYRIKKKNPIFFKGLVYIRYLLQK
jgi:predicted NAD-dependent protein-ADP-ribosyltransferase YbiA (DUF1768 family)